MQPNFWTKPETTTDEWETPQGLFNWLNAAFGFELDVCALPENAKCERYFTPDDDGLTQEWVGRCWMNPPYGPGIEKWLKKAYESAARGKAVVVCLVPAKTDTRWWHDCAIKGDVHFIRGRLRFNNSKAHAPFGSAVIIYWPKI